VSLIRARVVVCGRVQGVAFRASAHAVARAQRLSGWIRNCVDGKVEATVEGEEDAVQAFIAWCRHGPVGAYVSDVQVELTPYTGEWQDFQIAW
jgi:acylphosphatase